jgi:hypothetical protein
LQKGKLQKKLGGERRAVGYTMQFNQKSTYQ